MLGVYLILLQVFEVESTEQTGELTDQHQQDLLTFPKILLECHGSAKYTEIQGNTEEQGNQCDNRFNTFRHVNMNESNALSSPGTDERRFR